VAECVGRRALIEAVFFDVFFEHPGHAASREAGANLFVNTGASRPVSTRGESVRSSSQRFKRGSIGTNRSQAFFLTLTADANDAGGESRSPSVTPTSSLTRSPAE